MKKKKMPNGKHKKVHDKITSIVKSKDIFFKRNKTNIDDVHQKREKQLINFYSTQITTQSSTHKSQNSWWELLF